MKDGMSAEDRELGLGRPITRRDFVYGSALLAGGAMLGCRGYAFDVDDAWYGPGGTGDYASSHGNTPDVLRAAHEIRAGRFDSPPTDALETGEEYDLVIVGGGFSGLSAAHHFRRLRPQGRALILDNHPIFGGEAKRNEFLVDGVRISGPQGSNDFVLGPATGDPDDYFTSLGISRDLRYVEPTGAASGMRIATDNFSYLHWQHDRFDVGHHFAGGSGDGWVKDVWQSGLASTPWSPAVRQAFINARSEDPAYHAEGNPGEWLESITVKDYYERILGLPAEVTRYVDPILASIIGLGCDAIPATWGRHFLLPGFGDVAPLEDLTFHSFPGGNAGIARHFLRNLIPEGIEGANDLAGILFGPVAFDRLDLSESQVRIRLDSTVVRVEHEGQRDAAERVRITYTHAGRAYILHARHVVMASGGWVNRHIVKDLPDSHSRAYDTLGHSPVLVANVALRNWKFLERLGIGAAIYDEGFGFSCNIRRPMAIPGGSAEPLDPDQPIVLTFYEPMNRPGLPLKAQGPAGRADLLSTSFADYERRIRAQMTRLFSVGGFDPTRDIAGLTLNRWGHAYANPGPGFARGRNGQPAAADVIRQPIGRIAIGHSELRGHQNWTGAAAEGRRAVEALL